QPKRYHGRRHRRRDQTALVVARLSQRCRPVALRYAGRVGTGACRKRRSPSSTPPRVARRCRSPSRETRLGRRLVLSTVQGVRPELVAEITYLSWDPSEISREAAAAA